MPQFFLPPEAHDGDVFRLSGPEAFHLSKVLRCRKGENIDLFDGQGGRYRGRITQMTSEGAVEGVLTATLSAPHADSKVELNLYQSVLKGSRWEWILEKGTEVGVSRFIPVTTARTVVLLKDARRIQSKEDRWRKIILTAAKQCGRAALPEIGAPMAFRDALKEAQGHGITLFAWEKLAGSPARPTLREALGGWSGKKAVSSPDVGPACRTGREDQGEGEDAVLSPSPYPLPSREREPYKFSPKKLGGIPAVNLFIGPEGGFTEEEAKLAWSHNARFFSLGPNTLRGETAAIASAFLILYETGVL